MDGRSNVRFELNLAQFHFVHYVLLVKSTADLPAPTRRNHVRGGQISDSNSQKVRKRMQGVTIPERALELDI
jgi:hypothetical protein